MEWDHLDTLWRMEHNESMNINDEPSDIFPDMKKQQMYSQSQYIIKSVSANSSELKPSINSGSARSCKCGKK